MTIKPSSVKVGDVWRYPYLWARQSRDGETEGRKNRPCAVAFLIKREEGQEFALLLAITSKAPSNTAYAIEVPEIEKRRAKLDHSIPLWVILDERNEDVPNQSYYFEAGGYLGQFSAAFTKKIQAGKIAAIKARRSNRVQRRD